jgi:UDP-2-acetamido-2-deoxy-ribo-hexuluronate aminotransferase
MKTISMVDLRRQYLRIKPEIDDAIQEVLTSTAFIQGAEVNRFADDLGRFVNSPYTIPCANGTDALQIAMMALGFERGDEIILPVHTYVATAEVISLLGLTPVFIDVYEDTFNINVEQIERKVTARTKAIVPVHLYGQCADMEPILSIAQKYNLHIIEDAAQALGAEYVFNDRSTKFAGTIGTIGTTSFFPSKNLGCYGDGGAIFTADPVLAERIKMIANHGQRIKYHHDLVGVNSRLDTIQAAILLVKLKYFQEYTARRRQVADFYDQAFQSIPFLTKPTRRSNSTHVFHQYTLKIKNRDRDTFKSHLASNEIPSMIYYPVPLHLQKAYHILGLGVGTFPVAEELSRSVISLPIHTEMSLEELNYISEVIKNFR